MSEEQLIDSNSNTGYVFDYKKVVADLKFQGWKVRSEWGGNLITYEATWKDAKIVFTNKGLWSHTYSGDIEGAAVSFALQQIRRASAQSI